MEEEEADALADFRACNYDLIYLRPASLAQGQAVMGVLRALVEHFADRPHLIAETSEGSRPRARIGRAGGAARSGGAQRAWTASVASDHALAEARARLDRARATLSSGDVMPPKPSQPAAP